MNRSVLVLDFGSQFTQLIARRIRELGVFTEIRPCTVRPAEIELEQYGALILSGGPASVTDADAPMFDQAWIRLGLPTLGICYGLQLISHIHGAKLTSGASREYGFATLEVRDNDNLFKNFSLEEHTTVWMSHGDHVEDVPSGFRLLASSEGSPVAAFGDPARKLYAIQFHPEVAHTPRGKQVLSNFVFDIAGLKPNWNPASFIEHTIERVREEVGRESQVICGLSGGVDSTVAAVLVNRALPGRLTCIFVDNGLLRKDEAEQVIALLGAGGLGLKIKKVDASNVFLQELKGVSDPEKKRKIIGRVFIEVFEREARTISGVTHLVQGTLYPDVIESVSVRGPSVTIKSHHNVGGLPERMHLKLIEPLRELFKDEVRNLGRDLGIPRALLKRHPFPGPGLAVRVLGDVNEEKLAVLREADSIFREEVEAAGLNDTLWQAFAVLLPIQSVGVMGDLRTYEQSVALRAVTSEDGMTADWAYLPHELLRRTSSRIINEVRGVNRVVFDISSKPPATIEWE